MSSPNNSLEPFAVKDCALVAIATGKKAQNLKELRDGLVSIHPGSIYYHFWGGRLRPRFDDPEYNNDFAIWSHYSLHDETLAERIAVIDPCVFSDLESLRQEVVDVIEERLDEREWVPWVPADKQFHFVRSQMVVFDPHLVIQRPEDLCEVIPTLSVGSIFYHFIDGRRRPPLGLDDFRAWLEGFGELYRDLIVRLASVEPYFVTLKELRKHLDRVFTSYFKGTSE
jgi:hypothetical protein